MPSYKKGVFLDVFSFDHRAWERRVEFAKELGGVSHLELLLEYLPKNADELGALRESVSGFEVIIHAPFIHLTLMSHLAELNDFSAERYRETMRIGRELSASVITVHAGSYPVFYTEEKALSLLIEKLSGVAASEGGGVLTLENMPKRSSGSIVYPAALLHLENARTLMPNLNFTLDVGHCIQNDEEFFPFLKKYKDSIRTIHLHDALRRGRGHLALGKGELDLEKFVATLSDIGYSGFVSLETLGEEDTAVSWKALRNVEEKIWK